MSNEPIVQYSKIFETIPSVDLFMTMHNCSLIPYGNLDIFLKGLPTEYMLNVFNILKDRTSE